MNTLDVLDTKSWAERTFGGVQLHDRRRTRRAVHIGNERGRGFFVQTVLAVRPQTREVLGCMAQEPCVRIPAPEGEQRYQRRKRAERESDVWIRQVHAIGTPDPGSMWVHVGDRGADMFPFFQACQATQTHFLVRAAQNRRVQQDEAEITYSLTQARSFPSQASRPFEVPARHGHPARSTQLQLACGHMTLLPPRNEPRAGKDPVTVWVLRVWEEQAPEDEEPLEWIVVTSVPTTTLEQAWERVEWYRHRWLVEDYHQCLKSGCRIEERQGPPVDGLMGLLGLLSPLAVRLVQIRGYARSQPERPAHEVIEPLMLTVVAKRSGHSPATMTIGSDLGRRSRAWVARLSRSHAGPPGWRTMWKGWLSQANVPSRRSLCFSSLLVTCGEESGMYAGVIDHWLKIQRRRFCPNSIQPIVTPWNEIVIWSFSSPVGQEDSIAIKSRQACD